MQLRMLLALIMLCEARWSHMQLQKQLDQLLGSEEMDWRTMNTAFCSKCAFEKRSHAPHNAHCRGKHVWNFWWLQALSHAESISYHAISVSISVLMHMLFQIRYVLQLTPHISFSADTQPSRPS